MFSVDLQPGENLIKIYRQSEWVLAKTVLQLFVAIYVPAFLLVKNELLVEFGKLFSVWIILIFLFALNRYLLWLLNSYVLTDARLLVIHYSSLFKKQVKDCDVGKIVNLSFSTTGFFSSLLNFGNLEIQIAGINEPVVLKNLKRPENLKNFLWALKQHSENPKTG